MANGFLYILVCALILAFAGWIWYLVHKKMPAGMIAKRVAAVSVFFVLFLILDCFILITMLWDNHPPPEPYPYEHGYFHVINSSETSLLIDANFAYTRDELEKLQQQGINIDPLANFMTYRNVSLPDVAEGGNNYSFRIPISSYTIALPREFEIVLRDDIMGVELFRLNADLMDDHMKEASLWVITDSLLQCK